MTIGETLRSLRKSKHITLDKMSEDLGINKGTLSKYENNINSPKAEILADIARYYNVTTDYILNNNSLLYTQEQPKTKEVPYYELDKKDNEKLNKFMAITMAQAKFNLHTEQVEVSDEDLQKVEEVLKDLFAQGMMENKKKYTPKRYRKNKEKDIE